MSKQDPQILIPAYKDYLWGGQQLAKNYHKNNGNHNIAESWELSVHPDGLSHIGSQTLPEYIESHAGCLGLNDHLDIMIKLIDAQKPLSIQVHPDNTYAEKYEHDNGKTEMWVILDCLPQAFLYYGLARAVTATELRQRIQNGTLLEILNKVPVHKNDIFLIEPGTIHAIGAGIVVCEIQQSSNVTYRIYDYDRTDAQGHKRELHIDKALDVCKLTPTTIDTHPALTLLNNDLLHILLMRRTAYFNVFEYQVVETVELTAGTNSFSILIMIEGNAQISYNDRPLILHQGESLFIPAAAGKIKVNGPGRFLLINK